jgi:hypothetical protein
MTARHGTRRCYTEGCRCDECKEAQRVYQRNYRERRLIGSARRREADDSSEAELGPGPVERGVIKEIDGLASQARPGLAQVALALARILDNAKAVNHQPAAAKVLGAVLEKLYSATACGHRGNLALVRTMTEKSAPP